MGAGSNNIVADGLVCCWDGGNRRCGTPSAGGSWTGLGVNAPATLVNQAEFADISLGAILLDGTDDKVTVANTTDIDGAGGFTFDIWLYFLGMDSSSKYTVFSLHNSGGGAGEEFAFWIMDLATHAYTVRAGKRTTTGGVGTNRRSNDPALQPSANVGKWANWTFTYSGGDSAVYSSYKIYYNGEEKDDGTMGGPGNDGSANANRWGLDSNDYGDFDGYIGRVALYNKELTDAEIKQNYEVTKTRFDPRIAKRGMNLNFDAGDPASYPGGTSWKDTANGLSTTFHNMDASNFNSSNGGYFAFDGTDEYMSVLNSPLFQGAIADQGTFAAWFNIDEAGDDADPNIAIWGAGRNGSKMTWTMAQFDSSKKPLFGAYLGGSWSDIGVADTALSYDTWYYVVFTWDKANTQVKSYVNGALDDTDTTSSASITTSTAGWLGIGASLYNTTNRNTPYNFLPGFIGVLQLYDSVLSAAEIMDNFQKTRGRFGV